MADVQTGARRDEGVAIRPLVEEDRAWAADLIRQGWGSVEIVSRGVVHNTGRLPGLVACTGSSPVGLATYHLRGPERELVSLDAAERGSGAGTALVQAVVQIARETGCWRLWLITTNDNLDALRFYQRRGFHLVAVYPDALGVSRRIKPGIPAIGMFGIPLCDEIELEILLDRPGNPGRALR